MTEELEKELLLFGGAGFGASLILLLFLVTIAIGFILRKADKPFWHCFVPVYNLVQLLRTAHCSLWYLLFFVIPVVNIVFVFRYCIKLSKAFDGSVLLGIILFFLPFIGYPILGFAPSYTYVEDKEEDQ